MWLGSICSVDVECSRTRTANVAVPPVLTLHSWVRNQPRALLISLVRHSISSSRLPQTDFNRLDNSEGTWTDGRSIRHETSLNFLASRLSAAAWFPCAATA